MEKLYDGFVKVTKDEGFEVVHTTDAVAVLIYIADTRQVVFVRQKRVPMKNRDFNWTNMQEVPAGRFDYEVGVKGLAVQEVWEETGVKITGPHPLPTKKLKVPVRKTPCGQGTATWDRWELRIHKRLIIVDAEERVMRRIMRVRVPEEVFVSIELM